jgi:23S rRNA (pseudouridine1915-N3)-methyltransferase
MIRIIAVWDDFHHFSSGIEEYKKRLPDVELKLVKSEKSTDSKQIVRKETDRLIEILAKEKWAIIYLDIIGKTYSTEQFYEYTEKLTMQYSKITFLIGGAYWVDMERLQPYCTGTLSLSPLTFPHGMALLILLEQIYRISMIKKWSGYHHGN